MSQARATFQSRFTVIADTSNTSATWLSVSPAKNRNSTTRAARGSNVAKRASASSMDNRSSSTG